MFLKFIQVHKIVPDGVLLFDSQTMQSAQLSMNIIYNKKNLTCDFLLCNVGTCEGLVRIIHEPTERERERENFWKADSK